MATIVNVRNTAADGIHLLVTLESAPVGTPTFFASRLPGLAGTTGTEVLTQTGAGTSWTVAVLEDATEIRLPFYIAVEDDDGLSEEECEWVCIGTNLDLRNQIEAALQELIADNRKAINRSLQIWMSDTEWPDGTPAEAVKVLKGHPMFTAESAGGLPIVSVRIHDLREDLYFGNPYTDVMPVSGSIYVYAFGQGEGMSLEPAVAALGMGVFNVVNQAQNLNIELDCGLTCKAAHCEDFHTDVEFVGAKSAYMFVAEMGWKCEVYQGKRLH